MTTKAARKTKPKLLELDIVRAIAILAVVIIHATSEATVELPFGSGSQASYLAINKLCNFAVPVFIMVSGLVLFYRYQGDWSGRQSLQFYIKRVKQVLFPYLVWSLFYYLYEQWIYARDNLHLDWAEFAALLPWADASYHLYFMIIIVQFYLLFPLMMWLSDSYAWFRRGLIWIGILVQGIFYSYNHWVEPVANSASLCVNYFSMFTLGGWIGLHYETFVSWLRKHIGWVIPLTVLLGLSFIALFVLEGRVPILLEGTAYEVLFFSYAAFAGMSFIWLGRQIIDRMKGAARVLLSLGAVSFGVYLVHPAVLTYWRSHVSNETGGMLQYHAYTAASFLLSLFVPWLLVYIYGKLTGLLRRKKPGTVPSPAGR